MDLSITQALETWDKVKRQVPITKGVIAPMVKVQALATRAHIAAFETRVLEYSASLNSLIFWRYSTGVEDARAELDEAMVRQHGMRKECKKMEHIAMVFDLQDQVRGASMAGTWARGLPPLSLSCHCPPPPQHPFSTNS